MKRKGLEVARKMPRLRHSAPGEAFDIMRSDAAEWLVAQPKIRQLVFDLARAQGFIAYDPESGTWSGKEA